MEEKIKEVLDEIKTQTAKEKQILNQEKKVLTAFDIAEKALPSKGKQILSGIKTVIPTTIIGAYNRIRSLTHIPGLKHLGTLATLGLIGYGIYEYYTDKKSSEKLKETPEKTAKEIPKKISPKVPKTFTITPKEETYLQSRIELLKNIHPYDPVKGKQLMNKAEILSQQAEEANREANSILNQANQIINEWLKQENAILEAQRAQIHSELQNLMGELSEINEKKSNALKGLITTYLDEQRQILNNLIYQAPKLEPDEKTKIARNLALNLLAIVSVFSPDSRTYFLASIPQITEYWRNEDLYNFDLKMKEFQIASNLAQTQIDFLNQRLGMLINLINTEYDVPMQTLLEGIRSSFDLYNQLYNLQLENVLSAKDYVLGLSRLMIDEELRKAMLDYRIWTALMNAMFRKESLAIQRERLTLQEKRLQQQRQQTKEKKPSSEILEKIKKQLKE